MADEQMADEQRQASRSHVLRRARIVFRRGQSTVDCVVLDLSVTGAKLRVDQLMPLPGRFELRIENGPTRDAEIRYRARGLTGIRFIDAA